MYYDVNISLDYPKQDIEELEKSEYEGFCVNKTMRPKDLERLSHGSLEFPGAKRYYNRAEIVFGEGEQIGYDFRKAMRYDLFVVKLSGTEGMDKIIKHQPDMITFDYGGKVLPFKPGLVKTAIREGIFFEIPMREGLRGGSLTIMWIRNVRRLLFITNGKNIVVSSGAQCSMEIKKVRDVVKMLEMFGLGEKRALEVMLNSERLLKRCAMKRHCYRDSIVHSVDEGALKRDFVLSLYKN
ncbi:RNase P subunit p30-like protein [Encephalitozoon intestinalis ATCC 50506]|uniref:RNase P subunit p30-like protein n=1 Tax=Encephalitozoon intestinalis (strain ATCC 50506) TaxID=876142 RepID=E0S8T4_ENCIT|nr:RNase P subunit p30-like protein [Encephalitozoon intestinalis ATCC 50506]ADM12051.1 RNase P subunit p30-like protein [Encephalitozoon intestinalis ATCC 50506]UTX45841.1 ribonuclease P/MRP protein subunit RPP1 [Encephalitozoon intestinalis]